MRRFLMLVAMVAAAAPAHAEFYRCESSNGRTGAAQVRGRKPLRFELDARTVKVLAGTQEVARVAGDAVMVNKVTLSRFNGLGMAHPTLVPTRELEKLGKQTGVVIEHSIDTSELVKRYQRCDVRVAGALHVIDKLVEIDRRSKTKR